MDASGFGSWSAPSSYGSITTTLVGLLRGVRSEGSSCPARAACRVVVVADLVQCRQAVQLGEQVGQSLRVVGPRRCGGQGQRHWAGSNEANSSRVPRTFAV